MTRDERNLVRAISRSRFARKDCPAAIDWQANARYEIVLNEEIDGLCYAIRTIARLG